MEKFYDRIGTKPRPIYGDKIVSRWPLNLFSFWYDNCTIIRGRLSCPTGNSLYSIVEELNLIEFNPFNYHYSKKSGRSLEGSLLTCVILLLVAFIIDWTEWSGIEVENCVWSTGRYWMPPFWADSFVGAHTKVQLSRTSRQWNGWSWIIGPSRERDWW